MASRQSSLLEALKVLGRARCQAAAQARVPSSSTALAAAEAAACAKRRPQMGAPISIHDQITRRQIYTNHNHPPGSSHPPSCPRRPVNFDQGNRLHNTGSSWGSIMTLASAAAATPWGFSASFMRCFSTASQGHTSPDSAPDTPRSDAAVASPGSHEGEKPAGDQSPASAAPLTITLAEALARLVDTAVDLVGKGSLPEAISILKEGIATLEPKFPNSAEVGELYNQVALLMYFQNACEEAAEHAQISLDITRDRFGDRSKLSGLRMQRLATCKYGQGKLAEAEKLLEESQGILGKDDPAALEGVFYQHLIRVAGSQSDVTLVTASTQPMVDVLHKIMVHTGADNLVVSLMLAQHNLLLHSVLERSAATVALAEAIFRQHIALLEEVQKDSEELGITYYKLGTFYYSSGMTVEGAAAIRQAASIMAQHFPDDHDLVVLCRHRMGMLCTAAGDFKSATQLLSQSRDRYEAKPETSGLALEAKIGLAYARLHNAPHSARQAAYEDVLRRIDDLAATVGKTHMLVVGASKYFAKMP